VATGYIMGLSAMLDEEYIPIAGLLNIYKLVATKSTHHDFTRKTYLQR
jgi:hypothetical protein